MFLARILIPRSPLGFILPNGWLAARYFPMFLVKSWGALIASLALYALFPTHESLGATNPAGTFAQSWVLEVILTMGLMFVILSVSTGASEKGITAGIAIGSVVALEALFAGAISGASMNPARSLAPALVSGQVENLLLYLSAPVMGAALAVAVCICTREKNCCSCHRMEGGS